MSKKKHPEHVNHERWLVSYADFITLLFAFFVVLFASGQSDKRKQVKLARAIESAFQHNGIFDPHSKTPPLSDEGAPANQTAPAPITLPVPSIDPVAQHDAALAEEHIRQTIRAQVAAHHLAAANVDVRATPEGLVVSLREAGFFASGSANLQASSNAAFNAIAAALPHQPMRVEGHTDALPIHNLQFATNWELSTARASTITRQLIDLRAAEATKISAAGYAEFHPTASNATEAGRAQNRRVDIVLLPAGH